MGLGVKRESRDLESPSGLEARLSAVKLDKTSLAGSASQTLGRRVSRRRHSASNSISNSKLKNPTPSPLRTQNLKSQAGARTPKSSSGSGSESVSAAQHRLWRFRSSSRPPRPSACTCSRHSVSLSVPDNVAQRARGTLLYPIEGPSPARSW
eukprot:2176871-Rhodomonas_salina.1